jgi:hypothetical protein
VPFDFEWSSVYFTLCRNDRLKFVLLNCVPFSAAVFGMGATNSSMMGMQQQQGVYGNMQAGAQNMQQGMVGLQNQTQNPNFTQQRQQNQQ